MNKKYTIFLVAFIISLFGLFRLSESASVFFPYQGGTGTATVPSYGEVLIGTSDGKYTPVATSTLGITGSGGSSNPDFTYNTDIGFGVTGSATSTKTKFTAGVHASGTSQLGTASSTLQTIADALWLPFHTSAMLISDAVGKIAEYTGTTCTNQFVRALSALGVATCESVNLASDVTGTLPVANGGTGQASFGQGWLHTDGTTVTSSTSPTVNYLTATSTTATSTFAGGMTVAGSAGLTVLKNGNVGIGTNAPYAKIVTSQSTTSVLPYFVLNNAGGFAGGEPTIDWRNSAGSITTARISSFPGSSYADSALIFSVSDASKVLTERMRINVRGNIGIGTTSPYAKLSVWGANTTAGVRNFELVNSASTTLMSMDNAGVMTLNVPLAAESGGTGLNALGTGVATWLGTPSSANLASALTGETGSGGAVFDTSPTFITQLTTPVVVGTSYSATSTFPHASTTDWRVNGILDLWGTAASTFSAFVDQIIVSLKTKLTGIWDFGGADSLEIPNGTAPAFTALGQIGYDSTDKQLLVATTTADTPGVIPLTMKLWGGTLASTSVDFASGGRISLMPYRDGVTITEIHCYVDGGTSKVVNLDSGAGGANTDAVTCATTLTSDTAMSANYNLSAGALESVEFGASVGSPDYISFSVWGFITRE